MRIILGFVLGVTAFPSFAEDPKFSGRVQVRSVVDHHDDDSHGYLLVPRARFAASAKDAFGRGVGYKFQIDFGKGKAGLKDFYVDVPLFDRKGVRLWLGQGKKPFGRQQLTSSGRLALVDRAFTDKLSGAGRDVGLYLHNRFSKSPRFEWAIGLFNGTGANTVPDHAEPQLVARVGYNHGKLKGYSEGDLKGGALRFGLGASVMHIPGPGSDLKAEVDFVAKAHGLAATGGFFFDDGDNENTQSYHMEVSKVLGHWLPALRYADGISGTEKSEFRVGLTRLMKAHKYKYQASYGLIDGEEQQVLGQFQLAF